MAPTRSPATSANAVNMPAEAMEMAAPLHVRELALRDGSGGRGQHDGGRG